MPSEKTETLKIDPRKTFVPIGAVFAAVGVLVTFGWRVEGAIQKFEIQSRTVERDISTMRVEIKEDMTTVQTDIRELKRAINKEAWTREDMRALLKTLGTMNPDLKVPEVR